MDDALASKLAEVLGAVQAVDKKVMEVMAAQRAMAERVAVVENNAIALARRWESVDTEVSRVISILEPLAKCTDLLLDIEEGKEWSRDAIGIRREDLEKAVHGNGSA